MFTNKSAIVFTLDLMVSASASRSLEVSSRSLVSEDSGVSKQLRSCGTNFRFTEEKNRKDSLKVKRAFKMIFVL